MTIYNGKTPDATIDFGDQISEQVDDLREMHIDNAPEVDLTNGKETIGVGECKVSAFLSDLSETAKRILIGEDGYATYWNPSTYDELTDLNERGFVEVGG